MVSEKELSKVSVRFPSKNASLNNQLPSEILTARKMIDMWKKNHNAFGILYSWFLSKVSSQLELFPDAEFRVAYDKALKYWAKMVLGDSSDSTVKLEWGVMYKIALGEAKGLQYLHEGCQRRIKKRCIKIHDFGIAKWMPESWTHHTISQFEGTFAYRSSRVKPGWMEWPSSRYDVRRMKLAEMIMGSEGGTSTAASLVGQLGIH